MVNLTLQANRFELSGVPLAAAPGGATNAFAADMEARIVEGTVLSQSLIATETLTMVGVGATNASTVAASVQASKRALGGGWAAVGGCGAGGACCWQPRPFLLAC